MEDQVKKSRFKVAFSEVAGRVAIVDKNSEEDVETFSDNVPEELLVQRMMEIREDELFRDQIIKGTSLDTNISDGGIIVPGREPLHDNGNIIV